MVLGIVIPSQPNIFHRAVVRVHWGEEMTMDAAFVKSEIKM